MLVTDALVPVYGATVASGDLQNSCFFRWYKTGLLDRNMTNNIQKSIVDTTQSDMLAPLQAIVDQEDEASADLRSQRDFLIEQRAPLDTQISELNRQIQAMESPSEAMARRAIAVINNVLSNTRIGPMGRFIT